MGQSAFCTQGEHNRGYLHRGIFSSGALRESSLFADSQPKKNRDGAFGEETRSPIEGITTHSSSTRMTQLGVLFLCS
jgi:hypothetical protein